MVTDPKTPTPTDRTGYNTLRRSFASAQCNDSKFVRDSVDSVNLAHIDSKCNNLLVVAENFENINLIFD